MKNNRLYSTSNVSETLVKEIVESLQRISPYGSIEIYVQNNVVTQITARSIKKTNGDSKKLSGKSA